VFEARLLIRFSKVSFKMDDSSFIETLNMRPQLLLLVKISWKLFSYRW
jgi:hypothetical protein